MKDKTLETYCNGQVALVQETLSDGSYVYSVHIFGETIPCKSEKNAILLCQAFEEHTL